MNRKLVLILLTDSNSTSEEIIIKSLNFLKEKKLNYLFVGSIFFFKKLAKKLNIINNLKDFKKKKINFYNINLNNCSPNDYINKLTDISIEILKKTKARALINMPLNKKILGRKFLGYTDFFAKKINQLKKETMLLFNENLSVCTVTTHVPIKNVSNLITKKKILLALNNINKFYKKIIKKKVIIKVCGLNPHVSKDSFVKKNKDNNLIIPLLKKISKKNKKISGPHSADTVFLNSNNKVIVGMYHDQVLGSFKAIKKFKAINITLGLKYLRISPDHGTGLDIITNKRKINNESFKYCVKFCEKYLYV